MNLNNSSLNTRKRIDSVLSKFHNCTFINLIFLISLILSFCSSLENEFFKKISFKKEAFSNQLLKVYF